VQIKILSGRLRRLGEPEGEPEQAEAPTQDFYLHPLPTFFDILQEKLRKQFAYSSITGIIARERVLLDKLELI
jgi:hypothetical protein